MNQVTICIATYGDDSYWRPLREVAAKSAQSQSVPCDLVFSHIPDSDARNCGPSRNIAAEMATTEWLLFLDADDTIDRNCVEKLLAMPGDIRVPAISCQRVDGTWTEHKKLSGRFAWVIGSLVRRSDFNRLGGFRPRVWGEDSEFWLRCQMSGLSFSHSDDAIYRIGYRPDSRKTYKYRDALWSKMQTEAMEEFKGCQANP